MINAAVNEPHDFGTGLRAHLGLEEEELELLAEAAAAAEPEGAADDQPVEAEPDVRDEAAAMLETLIAFEQELLERERDLARRETALAGRAGALLAAAKSLHQEVVGGASKTVSQNPGDELARMRRRKSGAA